MQKSNRERKNEIKYRITLNEEQIEVKRAIRENQIVIITGRGGFGKSVVGAITALDFLFKKEYDEILVTRALVEVGKSMGYLPGSMDEKFNPYMEALVENLYSCVDGPNKIKVDGFIKDKVIKSLPIQFIRGKTINQILICEEAQNTTAGEMEALLTRLGKEGKIIINGDQAQRDTTAGETGLDFAIKLSKVIPEIKHFKLKHNHRSDLVGKILDYIYGK